VINEKRKKGKIWEAKGIALLFAVIFATRAFVSVGCARGTTPPEEEWNKTFGGKSENPSINHTSS